jgi:DNA-binding NarL/FixJ family response regulator
MDKLIKVLIVDDHRSLRNSFEREFCPENGFMTVGSIGSAAQAEHECQLLHPDVVIMDVCTVGEISGLKAAEMILKSYPQIKIVVTSGFEEITYIPRAKAIGAHAFVNKDSELDYFREVVKRVCDGDNVFPEPKTIPLPQGETPFSEREMEVLHLLCRQVGISEMAEKLFISPFTVKRHIENMRQKAGFDTYAELVIYVLSNGWINPNI